MKTILLASLLLLPAAAGAAAMESAAVGAERAFFLAPQAAFQKIQAAAGLRQIPQSPRAGTELPVLRRLGRGERRGAELGRVGLASQLDRNLFLMKKVLGSRNLDVGVAIDPGAKSRFLSFTDAAGTVLGAIGSLSDLRGKGVDIRIDAATSYNFRVEVGSIFDDPVHKSILHITPLAGTRGPSYDMTTGSLLDVMRAKSSIVPIDGDDYEIFYGRDARSDGSGFAGTRSFLVTHEAGMSTKAWPVSESDLPLNTTVAVSLGDVSVQMTRTSSELILGSGN